MDFSFPKKEKLKSKKTIELLFSEGSSVSAYPLKLIYIQNQLPENVRIRAGVAVPKKSFKSAVKRNRIKRLVRESYRLNKHMVFNNIEGNFAFLFLYIGKELPLYDEIDQRMIHILQKFLTKEKDAKID